MNKIYSILFLSIITPFISRAQELCLKNFGISTHAGFIYAHDKDVENTAGSRPFGVAVEFSRLPFDSASFNLARCYPKTGFSLFFFNYDNHILGNSVSAAYFVEPSFLISKRCMFAPRGSVGLSYLSNPYHPVHNPNNNSYSLPISVFLQAGIVFNYKVSKGADINAAVNYLHISNGGIRNPNKGINWPTASVGFNYHLNKTTFTKQKYQPAKRFSKYNSFVLGIYSSGKTQEKGGNQLHLVPGIFGGYHRRLNNLHSIGIMTDFHLDYSLAEKQKEVNEKQYFYFPSLALAHTYLIGKVSFWQQIGFYLIKPDERFKNWYHRWGLDYFILEKFSVGVSLKAHAQVAHFADLRFCYKLDY